MHQVENNELESTHQTLASFLHPESIKSDVVVGFINGETDEREIGLSELRERALGVLWHFQAAGIRPGDELILFTHNNEQFIDAFWACIFGGIVPVPVAVGISDDHRSKLLRIFAALQRPWLYTESGLANRLKDFAAATGRENEFEAVSAKTIVVDQIDDVSNPGAIHESTPDDVAFVQFSSGSTSDPKGVMLSHRNVLTNIRALAEGCAIRHEDVGLSWMPLTHDMGLIGFHLTMLASIKAHYIMDTRVFVRRPLLWLQKASEKRATVLCSPNFGYKHFLKVFESRGLDNVDLSCVRLVINGAEPISASLAKQFTGALAPFGLPQNSMYPVYGLAEASLGVTFPEVNQDLRSVFVQRHSLRVGEACEFDAQPGEDAVEFVLLGRPIRDCELRLVDDSDEVVRPGCVGHVQIRGGNVTRGYYGNHPPNSEVFADGNWLRTGDLGFEHDSQLVITGRSKDIIFVNGQNYYPHDIERVLEAVDGLELGKVVAAGTTSVTSGTDDLLVFVLYRGDLSEFTAISKAITGLVNEQTGLEVARVIPVQRIPKTTSGKVQRHKLINAYLDGDFNDALQQLDALRPVGQTEEPVGNDLEKAISDICNGIVVDRAVSLDDNLFEIGISSLALAQIHARIEEDYPGQLDIADVFEYPSIRELAEFMSKAPES